MSRTAIIPWEVMNAGVMLDMLSIVMDGRVMVPIDIAS